MKEELYEARAAYIQSVQASEVELLQKFRFQQVETLETKVEQMLLICQQMEQEHLIQRDSLVQARIAAMSSKPIGEEALLDTLTR